MRRLEPRDEAKITGGPHYVSFARLRVTVQAPTAEPRFMHLSIDGDTASLVITAERVSTLLDGLADVVRGQDDSALEPEPSREAKKRLGRLDKDSLPLGFWPCFGHIRPRP